MLTRRRAILGLAAAGLAAGAVGTGLSFRRDLRAARVRLDGIGARTVETAAGGVAAAIEGDGPPLLFLHGSGGGYDQGLLFAAPLVARGWQAIAPSRFGYPGTPLPSDATHRAQADAHAALLDALGVERAAVVGASAGAVSAASFAERHPDRCAALVLLVPAAPLPGAPPMAPWAPWQERMATAALRSDFLFWTLVATAPDFLTRTLLATDPALVAAASASEQARVRAILEHTLPIAPRALGILNDGRETQSPAPPDYAAIGVPTLALSFAGDLYETDRIARALAGLIPGAELEIYPAGGHVGVGYYDSAMERVDGFLRAA